MAKKSLGFYKDAWKEIRHDVSFRVKVNKDLSASDKGKITRYYNEIRSQTGFRPTFRYSTTSRANLESVKKYTGQESGFPGLRVAYIPIPNGSGKPKVKVRKGKVTVTTNSGGAGEVERVGYIFDQYGDVLQNTDATIKAIMREDAGQSVAFKMMCGKNESSQSVSKKFVNELVKHYLDEYDNADKWFFGIIGYSFDGQASFSEYLKQRKEKPRKPKGKHGSKKKTRRHRRRN